MSKRAAAPVFLFVLLGALSACTKAPPAATNPLDHAYGTEPDWNNPQHLITLNYQQAQGKRVFYSACVWCHADSTPAGPSNRYNLNPNPALMNDGSVLNPLTDEYLHNIIELGGSAMGKSGLMPPWGKMLSESDIQAVIAFTRAIAQPAYHPPARPASQYLVK
jgi:cytochrome c5